MLKVSSSALLVWAGALQSLNFILNGEYLTPSKFPVLHYTYVNRYTYIRS